MADTGPDPRFWRGQTVRLRYEDREVLAEVLLASTNGRSIFLEFEAIIDGHTGGMLIYWEDGRYLAPVTGKEVTLSLAPDEMA